jgi:hypothetical protein
LIWLIPRVELTRVYHIGNRKRAGQKDLKLDCLKQSSFSRVRGKYIPVYPTAIRAKRARFRPTASGLARV